MRAILRLLTVLVVCATAAVYKEKKIVCYWGSWSVYRKGVDSFNTTNIAPKLCTHLIYAFAVLNENNTVKVSDPFADLPDGGGKGGYKHFNQLRDKSPGLKTLIAIGGWNDGSTKYSKMVSTAKSRKTFVDSAVSFVKKYGFNGIDLHWEYPSQRDGVSADKKNFVLLLKELRARFDQKGLILTAAVGAVKTLAKVSYSIPEVSKYLHFINLMTYDFHVPSENKTGFSAPLYPGPWEMGDERLFNVNKSVNYWISKGAETTKIVLGMPFYGNNFILTDVNNNGIGVPAQGNGTLRFGEICAMLQKQNYALFYSKKQRTNYAIRNRQWIGYDNPRTIREKALFIQSLNLGGAMVWSIEMDDFRGSCGIKNILLKNINKVLRSSSLM